MANPKRPPSREVRRLREELRRLMERWDAVIRRGAEPVSYTHLDVYKRQLLVCADPGHAPKYAKKRRSKTAAFRFLSELLRGHRAKAFS